MFELLIYDFKKLLWQDELNPRVRCAFGNVSPLHAYNISGMRSAREYSRAPKSLVFVS